MEGYTPMHIRKKYKDIVINVPLTSALNTSSCLKITEDLLKYILYQRHQIPVQFDILARAAGRDNEDSDLSISENTCNGKVHSRKEEMKKLQFHKKRKRWLLKVRELVKNFRILMESLHDEFQEGNVETVSVILGSSVLTSREVYCISLPQNYIRGSHSEPLVSRQSLYQLFRQLVTHEELVKLVNKSSSLQRVWVMIKKTQQPRNSPVSSSSTASLIPRPDYSPHVRAQVVQINISHSPVTGTPMDLTPSVGAGITQFASSSCQKNGSKRSLCFSMDGTAKYHQANDTISDGSSDSGNFHTPMLANKSTEGSGDRETNSFKNWRRRRVNVNSLESPYLEGHEIRIKETCTPKTPQNFLNTPINMCQRDMEVMTETPTVKSLIRDGSSHHQATPSKGLSAQLDNFTLADTMMEGSLANEDTAQWFQVDHHIFGFKDVYL